MQTEKTDDCIFCGQRANTDEDIFPQWLLREVGPQPMKAVRTGPAPRERRVKSLKLKARIVCKTCNNEWMSRLEQAAKPILIRMLRDEQFYLDQAAQNTLAKWAVKMSMVSEHTLGSPPSDIYWSADERRAFSAPPHDIPGETDVLLGGYAGGSWRAMLKGAKSGVEHDSTGNVAPMIRSVVVCKPVLLLVQSDRYQQETGRVGWVWPPRHYDRLAMIYPAARVRLSWPCPIPMSEQQFAEFTGAAQPSVAEPVLAEVEIDSEDAADNR